MEEVKILDFMVYLLFFDFENRLFFILEWKGMGLGIKFRVLVFVFLVG